MLPVGGAVTRRERATFEYNGGGIKTSALYETDADADGTYESSTKTEFLSDPSNFTGYSQVLKETKYDSSGNVVQTIEYTIGHDEIAQTVTDYDGSGNVTSEVTHVFGHDGHGSVRVVFDMAAAIAQVFAFEAYGQLMAIHNGSAAFVSSSPSDALTSVLYSGEPFDAKIAQQYLRARWYDPATGRFNRLDPFSGNMTDPQSLHKYLYVHGDPVTGVDPMGLYGLGGFMAGFGIATSIRNMKISADLAALDAVKATIDGIRAGRSVQQLLFTIVWQELVGAGLGFAFGKALGLFGAVWDNGVGFGANRQAIREFFQSGAARISRVFRSLGLWRGKPDLPMPKRELSRRLAGKMAASDRWIAVEASETEMAAFAHSLPNEEVIAWGWRPNEGGPDVISVNRKTGEVTLWDAKWSDTEKSKLSFTIGNDKKARWADQARREIRDNTSLPKDVKAKALTQLDEGRIRTSAVGYGTLEGQNRVLVFPQD